MPTTKMEMGRVASAGLGASVLLNRIRLKSAKRS